MKRTLVVLALLLAVGIALTFAEDAAKPAGITFGSWARSIYAPLYSVDSDVTAGMGTSWGGDARVGFTIKGDSETAGFYVTMMGDNNSIGVPDDVAVYVKPIPGLKITGGTAFDDTLRNNGAAFGDWAWIRQGDGLGEDFGFTRVNSAGIGNAEISFRYEGLYIYVDQSKSRWALVDQTVTPSTTTKYSNLAKYGDSKDNPADALNNLAFGFGYTIEGIGQVKAQRLAYAASGATEQTLSATGQLTATKDFTYNLYEAGFSLAAVPNLSAEADIRVPSDNKKANFDFAVPVSGSYKAGQATINAYFLYTAFNKQGIDKNSIAGGAGVDYDIGDGLGFTSSVRYSDKYWTPNQGADKARTAIFAGLNKTLAVGQIGFGFEYCTLAFGTDYSGAQSADKAQWAIPIKWEVSF